MGQLIPHVIDFPTFENDSSFLSVGEFDHHLPFAIERIYWSYGSETPSSRGNHYHPNSSRVIICMNGSIEVTIEDLKGDVKLFQLFNPNQGLFIPKNLWITMQLDANAIMLVIASTKFQDGESISDYSKFEALKNG